MKTFWKLVLSVALSGLLVAPVTADDDQPNRGKGKGNATARNESDENGKGRSDEKAKGKSDDDQTETGRGQGKDKDKGRSENQGKSAGKGNSRDDNDRSDGPGNGKGKGNTFANGKGNGNAFANGKGSGKGTDRDQPIVLLPKEIELSDEQKLQVAEIEKEFSAKMTEAKANLNALLTDDQKKARQDVIREARDSGKKGRELQFALKNATKASEGQQRKIESAELAISEIQAQALEKAKPILTDGQRAKLIEQQAEGKKPKGKKAA